MITVQCPFDPKIYKDQPMGMFHCPWCGEMQLAGLDHLPKEIELDELEYKDLVQNMKDIRKSLNMK